MAASWSHLEPVVGDIFYEDSKFFKQLGNSYKYLYLHLLPFDWFKFIFYGRPYDEIWDNLSYINEALQNSSKDTICPELKHIWRWTEFMRPWEVKVVILGQDPYPGYVDVEETGEVIRASNGYGFSMDTDYFIRYIRPLHIDKIYAPSLENIINMANGSFKDYLYYGDGDLTSWYRQGVLMLDLALTTVAGQTDAHKDIGWDYVTKLAIKRLGEPFEPRKVFMFWQKGFKEIFANYVDERYHFSIFRCHPASYRRERKGQKGSECGHKCWSDPKMNCFVAANKFLANLYEPHYINWDPLR